MDTQFKPGMGKTGGRQKGTPNKISLGVLKHLQERGMEPLDEILKLLPDVKPERQLDVWMRLMAYCYPQLRAITVDMGDDDASSKVKELLANGSAVDAMVKHLTEKARAG
jgi:hypothetical protein